MKRRKRDGEKPRAGRPGNSRRDASGTDKRIVLSTTGSKEEAQRIARALVERRLAACVNIVGPIESVYRWKGAVESAEEFLCVVKTTAAAADRVRAAIQELHSYEVAEVVVILIEGGSNEYLSWIAENVK